MKSSNKWIIIIASLFLVIFIVEALNNKGVHSLAEVLLKTIGISVSIVSACHFVISILRYEQKEALCCLATFFIGFALTLQSFFFGGFALLALIWIDLRERFIKREKDQ